MIIVSSNIYHNHPAILAPYDKLIFLYEQVIDTKDKKVRKFLDILPRRGPKAFQVFLDVLKETKNEHIIDKLVTGGASPTYHKTHITQPVDLPVGGDTRLPESKSRLKRYQTFIVISHSL